MSRIAGYVVGVVLMLCWTPVAYSQDEPLATAPQADTVPEGLTSDAWQAVRAAVERDRYAAQMTEDGTLEVANPAQAYRAHFTSDGITVQPRDTDFALGLRLERWGYGEALKALPATEPIAACVGSNHCGPL